MTLEALTGHLADISRHLGSIDGRLSALEERVDSVHRLARATNGRVNGHDLELAREQAAREALAMAVADVRKSIGDRQAWRVRVAGWVVPSIASGAIALAVGWLIGGAT